VILDVRGFDFVEQSSDLLIVSIVIGLLCKDQSNQEAIPMRTIHALNQVSTVRKIK
jgi:hypothetical protein